MFRSCLSHEHYRIRVELSINRRVFFTSLRKLLITLEVMSPLSSKLRVSKLGKQARTRLRTLASRSPNRCYTYILDAETLWVNPRQEILRVIRPGRVPVFPVFYAALFKLRQRKFASFGTTGQESPKRFQVIVRISGAGVPFNTLVSVFLNVISGRENKASVRTCRKFR